MDLHDLLSAIDVMYECVGDRYDYHRATAALGQGADDTALCLMESDKDQSGFVATASYNVPEESVSAQVRCNNQADANTLVRNLSAIEVRVPVLRRYFVSDEEHSASALYRESGAPWGFHCEGACIIEKRPTGGVMLYGFARTHRQREVDHEILSRLAILSRHMWRAMTLQGRLTKLEEAVVQANNVLDLIDFGLVLYQPDGRVGFVNRAARRMLDDGDGLELRPEGLAADDRNAQRQLCDIVEIGNASSLPLSQRSGAMLRVPRPSGRKPYNILATPTRGRSVSGLEGVNLAIFIFDPDSRAVSAVNLFLTSYDLTPVEAELAYALAQGSTLDEFSARRGITRNTAKWHLQSIFEKTETSRQPELISLLLRSVAGVNLNNL